MHDVSFALRRTRRYLFAIGAVLALGLPLGAQAQSTTVCDANVKAEVIKALEGSSKLAEKDQLNLQAQLYDKYSYCASNDSAQILPTDGFYVAARQCGAKVGYVGSLYYEEMPCCGYDPQRRSFACPVRIKKPFGFGGNPLPGSREYTLHCVADAAGNFVAAGRDSVHLSDAVLTNDKLSSWQFAVVAQANEALPLVQPMNGATRRARSILSWNFKPTGCDYRPIWGNAIEYSVRLDQ